jgi:hypothetical protein
MIQVNGHNEEMAKISTFIPGFLQLETCQLGGSAISLNATAITGSQSIIQVLVWAPKQENNPSDLDNKNPYRGL